MNTSTSTKARIMAISVIIAGDAFCLIRVSVALCAKVSESNRLFANFYRENGVTEGVTKA
jgi:hypothetical protein